MEAHLPETLDRDAVTAAVAEAFGVESDRVQSVRLAADTHPAVVLISTDIVDVTRRVVDALGLYGPARSAVLGFERPDLPVMSGLTLDADGATIILDGEPHHIPFADTMEEAPCPA